MTDSDNRVRLQCANVFGYGGIGGNWDLITHGNGKCRVGYQ